MNEEARNYIREIFGGDGTKENVGLFVKSGLRYRLAIRIKINLSSLKNTSDVEGRKEWYMRTCGMLEYAMYSEIINLDEYKYSTNKVRDVYIKREGGRINEKEKCRRQNEQKTEKVFRNS